jgi:hypothetical protein
VCGAGLRNVLIRMIEGSPPGLIIHEGAGVGLAWGKLAILSFQNGLLKRPSSLASSRSARMRSRSMQNAFLDGARHTWPFQRLSCHATRKLRLHNAPFIGPPLDATCPLIQSTSCFSPCAVPFSGVF